MLDVSRHFDTWNTCHVQNFFPLLKICTIFDRYNNDADVPVLLQSGNEEKEPSRAVNTKIGSEGHASGDPSYQVMLESYVLQLLCVQKVLKEASEPNNVKKV
ncbi:uncharacterized protein LOC131217409 [Magnolia sinica]|uniref:uncharacterized protein LOC131217409 n=1 Tax=Magnolia sinica TaxID=86752 RepID=UPI00265A2725|nr:uncharacterized protein LOC131217409 [Magnolia sinica]